MNALVIYDSQYGNTKIVAEAISKVLGCIAIKVSDVKENSLKGLSLLIVGSPIQGWRPLPSITTMLESLPINCLNGIKVAAFDTRIKLFIHGDAAGKINNKLIQLGGKEIIKPQGFIVKGSEGPLEVNELQKAQMWAKEIKEKIN
jgi:flavodoxin